MRIDNVIAVSITTDDNQIQYYQGIGSATIVDTYIEKIKDEPAVPVKYMTVTLQIPEKKAPVVVEEKT